MRGGGDRHACVPQSALARATAARTHPAGDDGAAQGGRPHARVAGRRGLQLERRLAAARSGLQHQHAAAAARAATAARRCRRGAHGADGVERHARDGADDVAGATGPQQQRSVRCGHDGVLGPPAAPAPAPAPAPAAPAASCCCRRRRPGKGTGAGGGGPREQRTLHHHAVRQVQ